MFYLLATPRPMVPMQRSFRRFLLLAVMLLAAAATAHAQSSQRDSVFLLQTPSGTYINCFDIEVRNRQPDSTLRISDFRLRIISGRATFMPGFTQSAFNWALVSQTSKSVTWTANTAAAEIRPNTSISGFRVCIADTGVFKLVWETHTLDSLVSADTLAYCGRKGNCDEAFFKVIPSQFVNMIDIDLSAGNGTGRLINGLNLHPVTPGIRLNTAVQSLPADWVRLKVKTDSIYFFTSTKPLDFNQFVEGFRVKIDSAKADSLVRIEWWTSNFGDQICYDTADVRFGLSRPDSVIRLGTPVPAARGCAVDLLARNLHQPASELNKVTLRFTTPGVVIDSLPSVPIGWTATTVGADSLIVSYSGQLEPGDSALLQRIVLFNGLSATDTVRYTWYTHAGDIPVCRGTGSFVFQRPLLNCDTLTARVDSTIPAASRCIYLTLKNRNSRRDQIARLLVKVSNPGTARRILSANAVSPWRVSASSGDSVLFVGGIVPAGGTASGFSICVSTGDTAMHDPLALTWSAVHIGGPECGAILPVNADVTVACDEVVAAELAPPDDSTMACFSVRVRNRNARGRTVNHIRFDADPSIAIISLAQAGTWRVGTPSFPSFDLDLLDGSIAAGGDSPDFQICLQLPGKNRPATIPLAWRTYAGDTLICGDTVRLLATGTLTECPAIVTVSDQLVPSDACLVKYAIVNRSEPSIPVNGFRVRPLQLFRPSTPYGWVDSSRSAAPAGWAIMPQSRSIPGILFRGPFVAAGDSLGTFDVTMGGGGVSFVEETCTMVDSVLICCIQRTRFCGDVGAETPLRPWSFTMGEAVPNPTRGRFDVGVTLVRPADLWLSVRDLTGRELRKLGVGLLDAGDHRVTVDLSDFAAGTYYVSMHVGGEMDSRRVVVVR